MLPTFEYTQSGRQMRPAPEIRRLVQSPVPERRHELASRHVVVDLQLMEILLDHLASNPRDLGHERHYRQVDNRVNRFSSGSERVIRDVSLTQELQNPCTAHRSERGKRPRKQLSRPSVGASSPSAIRPDTDPESPASGSNLLRGN